MPIFLIGFRPGASRAARVASASVAIEIDPECSDSACIDDNFCIEVILATFDFFRVSETKQD